MASFLVVQGPYDYFAMSSKWTDAGGMNWHNQFDRFKCGEPLSLLPAIDGAVWTREFQNCSVRYDRSLAQCGSVSGVGCGTISIKPAEANPPPPLSIITAFTDTHRHLLGTEPLNIGWGENSTNLALAHAAGQSLIEI